MIWTILIWVPLIYIVCVFILGIAKLHSTAGFKYIAEGIKFMRTEEGKAFRDANDRYLGPSPFLVPDVPLRRLSQATGYLLAKNTGMSETDAINTAIKWTWFLQGAYDVVGLPHILRGPIGRTLGQPLAFMIKTVEFMSTLRGVELLRFAAWLLALAGLVALYCYS
jgi:hypothetical protein